MEAKILMGLLLLASSCASIRDPFIEKEGVCTFDLLSGLSRNDCHLDSECDSYLKCCPTGILGIFGRRVCRIPYFPFHPNFRYRQCPYQNEEVDGLRCGTDRDCARNMRCCPNTDGRSVCKIARL